MSPVRPGSNGRDRGAMRLPRPDVLRPDRPRAQLRVQQARGLHTGDRHGGEQLTDKKVDVRAQTATVHRYYVEVITDIKCKGTPSFGANPCEGDDWWKHHPQLYERIMEHVHTKGHKVTFKVVDYCSAEPVGTVLAPDAADFLQLRKDWGDLEVEGEHP